MGQLASAICGEPGFLGGKAVRLGDVPLAGASTLAHVIDGELVPCSRQVGRGAWLLDPNDQRRLEPQASASAEEVERALAAAWRAHTDGAWRGLSVEERRQALRRVATELEALEPAIAQADAVNTGVTVALTRCIAESLKQSFLMDPRAPAGREQRLLGGFGPVACSRAPWGPAVVLAPWNVPGGSAAPKVAAALLAGCPVILKPSEWAPHGLDLLGRAAQSAALPPGVFQLLHGGPALGQALVADRRCRVVNFTGSAAVGRAVQRRCADLFRPSLLELGGSNPVIVRADAELATTAAGIVQALTTLNGQWCGGPSRIIVHRSVESQLVREVVDQLRSVTFAASTDASQEPSAFGPVAHRQHWATLQSELKRLKRLGGSLHRASEVPPALSAGNFVPPTLVTGVDMQHCLLEVFGPIATVHPFDSDDEAVAMANATDGMVLGTVYSRSLDAAGAVAARLEAGMVMINGSAFGFDTGESGVDPRFSYWGAAGCGEDGPPEALLEFFSGCRVVGVNGSMPGAR